MVHKLRKKDGIMSLLCRGNGAKISVLNFGSLSVLPNLQKTGIGSTLMIHSIEAAKKQGNGAILFFGHPDYYPRFGFVQAKIFNITDREGQDYPALMVIELKPDYLKNTSGKFIEADIYS